MKQSEGFYFWYTYFMNTNKGFVRTIVLIVIALFILSYFNIFKVEEHINPGQIKAVVQTFFDWLKGLWE
jgi:hypothetical protein